MDNNKINIRDKWFYVFAFIPFLQWVTCFMFYSRTMLKRPAILGFLNAVAYLSLIMASYVLHLVFKVKDGLFYFKDFFPGLLYRWNSTLILPIAIVIWLGFLVAIFFVERTKYEKMVANTESTNAVSEFINIASCINRWDKYFLFLSFIPYINWLSCFFAYERVRKLRYMVFGLVGFLLYYGVLALPYEYRGIFSVFGPTFEQFVMPYFIPIVFNTWFFLMIIMYFFERPIIYRSLIGGYNKKFKRCNFFQNVSSVGVSDKWFFVFTFVPILQWIPWFFMFSKRRSIRRIVIGIVVAAACVALLVTPYLINMENYRNYRTFRIGINFFVNYELPVLVFTWLLIIVITWFVERPSYYYDMVYSAKKHIVKDSINSKINDIKPVQNHPRSTNAFCPKCGSELTGNELFCGSCGYSFNLNNSALSGNNNSGDDSDKIKKLEINSASEEEFIELLNLSVVEVKQIISVRENKGGFADIDEFYSAFNARPHVIAKISEKINLDEQLPKKNNNRNTNNSKSVRNKGSRFDI